MVTLEVLSASLLQEADIVCTNPPFSLFREYVAQLVKYDKKFLIIGNQNAITYKEIFPLLKDNKIWLGCSIHNGDREFEVPAHYNISKNYRIENGRKFVRVRGPRWFTNLDYKERHDEIPLYKKYTPEEYLKYANYDAIEVSKTKEIPENYDGQMGVPITFLDKYCPEQFEIIGYSREVATPIKEVAKRDDKYSAGGNAFYIRTSDNTLERLYGRIVIRRRKNEN